MTYINLTPHPVVLMPDDGEHSTIPASGTVARIAEVVESVTDGYATVRLGDVIGLPDPAPGVVCVVSMPLLMALAAKGVSRTDVVYPYGQIRDEQGRIVGCRTLAQLVAG